MRLSNTITQIGPALRKAKRPTAMSAIAIRSCRSENRHGGDLKRGVQSDSAMAASLCALIAGRWLIVTRDRPVGRICNPSSGVGRITNPSYVGSTAVSSTTVQSGSESRKTRP